MRFSSQWVTLGLVFALLVGVVLTTAPVRPTAAQSTFSFEESACLFEVAAGDVVDCGYVTVPENHADPNSDPIRLPVAILRTSNPNPPADAVIYLDGGPGGDTLVNYGPALSEIFSAFTATRDVIIFDQRGTGYSEPSLDCPEIQTLILENLDNELSDAEFNTLSNEAAFACRDRILNETTASLEFYNTLQNAADVDAIRQALGYEQFNLYGISYGTRLALQVMRDFPTGVRSAILDSAVPLEADFNVDFAQNTNRVFDLLFESCEADAACNAAYPDLKNVFLNTAAALDENPVIMDTYYQDEVLPDLLRGDYFMTLLFQSLYATTIIPLLPQIIDEVSNGNYETLGLLAGFFLEDTFSEGMNYSFNCNEEYAFTNLDEALASFETYAPEYAPFISTEALVMERDLLNFCAAWGSGVAPASENEAVVSAIPSLLVAGEFDPVTPPRYTAQIGENVTNSVYIEIPGGGHGPSLDGGCPTEIAGAFVENPDPAALDISCVAAMPGVEFALPDGFAAPAPVLESVSMVAYESQTLGISGLAPEGWQESEDGIFELVVGAAPFMAYRVPEDGLAGYVERIIVGGYGYAELPAPMETVEINGISWNIYDIVGQDLFVYFAMTEIDGRGYVIGVAGNSEPERALLYEQALKPTLNSFAVLN